MPDSPFDRRGQLVVVSGAAGGIGAAIACRAHAEGAELVLFDADERVRAVAQDLGSRARAVVGDVTEPAAWDPITAGPPADVLVHCAGILGPQDPVVNLSLDGWSRVIDVNLTGAFVASRAVLPGMLERGRGWIVHLASIGGKEGNPGQSAYCAAKAGVIGLTKSLAKEVADAGVVVNCLAPTVVEGPFANDMDLPSRKRILAKIPMGRFTTAAEVAALVSWMSCPDCSFTTGFCFDLSGGRATY